MCGIFGSPTLTPSVKRMLPYLGIEMQSRGHDAWGASDGHAIIRHVGPLVDTWHSEEPIFNQWSQGIFHTRGASTGSAKELENAHPFTYLRPDGTQVIGIHNGIISNHSELDSKYGRNCSVDSMHIWMHRAEGLPWGDLQGWGNLAWWEGGPRGTQRLSLARFNNDALKVAQLEGGEYVFCSTMGPIIIASKIVGNGIRRWMQIDEFFQYWFAPDQRGELTLYKAEERLPFSLPSYGYGNHGRGGYFSGDGYCAKCGHTRVDSKAMVLCYQCFGMMVTDFIAWENKQKAPLSIVAGSIS